MMNLTLRLVKAKKFFRIYATLILFSIYLIEAVAYLTIIYFEQVGDYEKFITMSIQSLVTLIVTFAGIFIPLQIQRIQKKQDNLRSLGFQLSFVSNEIRQNLFKLKQAELNFVFKQLIDTHILASVRIDLLLKKFGTIVDQTAQLSHVSFDALQIGNTASNIDEDNYFNAITNLYSDLELYKSKVGVTHSDLILQNHILNVTHIGLNPSEVESKTQNISRLLKNCYAELLRAIHDHEVALEIIDAKLVSLGIITTVTISRTDTEVDLK